MAFWIWKVVLWTYWLALPCVYVSCTFLKCFVKWHHGIIIMMPLLYHQPYENQKEAWRGMFYKSECFQTHKLSVYTYWLIYEYTQVFNLQWIMLIFHWKICIFAHLKLNSLKLLIDYFHFTVWFQLVHVLVVTAF